MKKFFHAYIACSLLKLFNNLIWVLPFAVFILHILMPVRQWNFDGASQNIHSVSLARLQLWMFFVFHKETKFNSESGEMQGQNTCTVRAHHLLPQGRLHCVILETKYKSTTHCVLTGCAVKAAHEQSCSSSSPLSPPRLCSALLCCVGTTLYLSTRTRRFEF